MSGRLRFAIRQCVIFALAVTLAGCAGTRTSTTVPESPDDASISARVKAALAANPSVRAHFITVMTSQGVVELSGFLESRLESEEALEIARSVSGVRGVKDNIGLRAGGGVRRP